MQEVASLTSSDWMAAAAGIGGALLGAVVGGVISYLLQMQAFKASADNEAAARKDNALRLMVRASIILNDVAATVDSIHTQLDRANQDGMTGEPLWTRINPIVGIPDEQPLEMAELSPFMNARQYDVVTGFIEMTMRHKVLNEAVGLYNEKRTALSAMMPVVSQTGSVMFSTLKQEDLARLTPYITELESLAQQMKVRSEALLSAARVTNEKIGKAGTAIFGPSFPRIDVTQIKTDDEPAA